MSHEYLPLEIGKYFGMYLQWSCSRYDLKQHIREKIIGFQDTWKLEIIHVGEVDFLQVLFLQLSETAL